MRYTITIPTLASTAASGKQVGVGVGQREADHQMRRHAQAQGTTAHR